MKYINVILLTWVIFQTPYIAEYEKKLATLSHQQGRDAKCIITHSSLGWPRQYFVIYDDGK